MSSGRRSPPTRTRPTGWTRFRGRSRTSSATRSPRSSPPTRTGERPELEERLDRLRERLELEALFADPGVAVGGARVAIPAVADEGDDAAALAAREHLGDEQERSPDVRPG